MSILTYVSFIARLTLLYDANGQRVRAILAVAQTVVRPLSPAPDAAVSRQREAVQGARRHGNDAPPRERLDSLRQKLAGERACARRAAGGRRVKEGRRYMEGGGGE